MININHVITRAKRYYVNMTEMPLEQREQYYKDLRGQEELILQNLEQRENKLVEQSRNTMNETETRKWSRANTQLYRHKQLAKELRRILSICSFIKQHIEDW